MRVSLESPPANQDEVQVTLLRWGDQLVGVWCTDDGRVLEEMMADLESLHDATCRDLDEFERMLGIEQQQAAKEWCSLCSGLTLSYCPKCNTHYD